MNKKVERAIKHVQRFHPNVTMVVFNVYGQWNYCDDNFEAPFFDRNIKNSILKDASDSLDVLPCVFHISTSQ